MKPKVVITITVLSVILIALGLSWRENGTGIISSRLGGTADIIQGISLDKTEICSGESIFVSVDITSPETSQDEVLVYINNQLGNPQHISFSGLPGERKIVIAAATQGQEFEMEEIAIEVLDCEEEVEFLELDFYPNPFQEHAVDFSISNAKLFIDQDPMYVWNFGDGQSLQIAEAYTHHSYDATITADQPYYTFQASVTLKRDGYKDLTAYETITLWNTYAPTEAQPYVQPQVSSDKYLQRTGNNWEGDYSIKNKGSERMEFSSSQVTIHPCDPDRTSTTLPQESVVLSVGGQRKVTRKINISADQIGEDDCNLEVLLSGQNESGQAIYANVYFGIQPNPLMFEKVSDTAMLGLLKQIADQNLVDDPFNISEEDLYRLAREGKITYPSVASSRSAGKVTPKLFYQPYTFIGQPCQTEEGPPPGAGTYDDRDKRIKYSGSWYGLSSSFYYNNTSTASGISIMGPYDSGSFTFSGSKITLVYTNTPFGGMMDVSIDGVLVDTITMLGFVAYQQEWTSGDLSPGIHTLTFEHTGGLFVDIDALKVSGPSIIQPDNEPPPGAGTYDDDDSWSSYSEFWQQVSPSPGRYNNTSAYSDVIGNNGTYVFNGSEVTLVYTQAPNYGTLDVSIDGLPVDTIDMSNPTTLYQQEWSSAALSPGIHTLIFEHASGPAVEVDAFIVSGPSPIVTCQATGNWTFSPPFIANALKGDVILSAGCGLVGDMLRQLVPPQRYSHTGIMTQDYYQITHSTASEERYSKHTVGCEGAYGFNEAVLRWGWPGVITQSVDKAFNGEWIRDPENIPYWMVGFHSYPVECQGDDQYVWPMVVKPPPDAPPIVREYLHKVADKALASDGHYRFYVYSEADVGLDSAYDDPWGKPATVCSQFVWQSVQQVNAENTTQIILEGDVLEANDIANGAVINPTTPDGLYVYSEVERQAAALSLYNFVFGEVWDLLRGQPCSLVCDSDCYDAPWVFGNQFTNCFANDDCTPYNYSTAWQTPGEGEAVSPDDILFWDDWTTVTDPGEIGVYGYSERLAYRSGEYMAETTWQYGGLEGDLEGQVLTGVTPVEGARVTIANIEVFTDANGEFSVPNITAGEYEITASQHIAEVLMTDRQIVEIKPGETTSVELTLQAPIGTTRVYIDGYTRALDHESFSPDEIRICEFQSAPELHPFQPYQVVKLDPCCAGDEVRVEAEFLLQLESQSTTLFTVGTQYSGDLDLRIFSNDLRLEFENQGITPSDDIIIDIGEAGDDYDWLIYDRQLQRFFHVINAGSLLRIDEIVFPGDVNAYLYAEFYEDDTCYGDDREDSGHWGWVTIPMESTAYAYIHLYNEDPWEPDKSYADLYYNIRNNPDLISDITDLAIEKDDGVLVAYPGNTITYVLTYANQGDQEATGVVLLEVIPQYTTFIPAASSPGWDCQPDYNAGSQCTFIVGTVEVGGPYDPVEFAVKVDNPPPDGVDLIVNIASIQDDGIYGAEAYPLDNQTIELTTILPDTTPPHVVSASPTGEIREGPNRFTIVFSEEMKHGDSNDPNDVAYPGNYLMVWGGGILGASTCADVLAGIDVQVPVGPVSYDNATYTAIVAVPNGESLPKGFYRVFLCGTSTLMDPSGNPLLGGEDYSFDFLVSPPEDRSGGRRTSSLPGTGFRPGVRTLLPPQPPKKTYAEYNELRLEIPRLGVDIPIVGVPKVNGEWDIQWLGNNAGYMEGTAFPTRSGNTGITAHVWDADNNPGPFAGLRKLQHGDVVRIHAWGYVYSYEVRYNYLVRPDNPFVMKHEDYDWVTLLTCENYSPDLGVYRFRRVVRAVLLDVQ